MQAKTRSRSAYFSLDPRGWPDPGSAPLGPSPSTSLRSLAPDQTSSARDRRLRDNKPILGSVHCGCVTRCASALVPDRFVWRVETGQNTFQVRQTISAHSQGTCTQDAENCLCLHKTWFFISSSTTSDCKARLDSWPHEFAIFELRVCINLVTCPWSNEQD